MYERYRRQRTRAGFVEARTSWVMDCKKGEKCERGKRVKGGKEKRTKGGEGDRMDDRNRGRR